MKLFPAVTACLLLSACSRPAADQSTAVTTTTNAPAAAPVSVAPVSVDLSSLHEPLKTVVQSYLVIEQKLVADSLDGVPAAAAAMKQAVEADNGKTFNADFAKAVGQLAAATDLHTTRIAFQPLSATLIDILARDHVQTGLLHSAFCPMVKAYWLQADGQAIHNPYMGSVMPDCGSFQKQF